MRLGNWQFPVLRFAMPKVSSMKSSRNKICFCASLDFTARAAAQSLNRPAKWCKTAGLREHEPTFPSVFASVVKGAARTGREHQPPHQGSTSPDCPRLPVSSARDMVHVHQARICKSKERRSSCTKWPLSTQASGVASERLVARIHVWNLTASRSLVSHQHSAYSAI